MGKKDYLITVEGFQVVVMDNGKGFSMSVPALPGIIGQVDKESEIVPEMTHLIRSYLKAGLQANLNRFTEPGPYYDKKLVKRLELMKKAKKLRN